MIHGLSTTIHSPVNMVLGLKSHLQSHQISSIPFTNLVRKTQIPLFQVQPIQTSSFSPLQLNSRRKSPKGFNASYLEGSNSNGGGGGGVEDARKVRGGDGEGYGAAGEVLRLFLRWAELLLGSRGKIIGSVGLPAKLVWLCEQVLWQLHLALIEIGNAFMLYTCVGVVLISAVITFLFLHLA